MSPRRWRPPGGSGAALTNVLARAGLGRWAPCAGVPVRARAHVEPRGLRPVRVPWPTGRGVRLRGRAEGDPASHASRRSRSQTAAATPWHRRRVVVPGVVGCGTGLVGGPKGRRRLCKTRPRTASMFSVQAGRQTRWLTHGLSLSLNTERLTSISKFKFPNCIVLVFRLIKQH